MKVYKFKIINKRDKKNLKVLEVASNMSLSSFAEQIVYSFGFYFDHAFCFTSDLTNPYHPAEKLFELFADDEDCEPTEGARSVEKNTVSHAFEKVGDKMLFLFDYGDGWEFLLKLIDSNEVAGVTKEYFKLIESQGKDPKQYPESGM